MKLYPCRVFMRRALTRHSPPAAVVQPDERLAPALLAGLLALVTLVLTMGGLYAVLTMVVGQRTRELAIRMALGTRGDLGAMNGARRGDAAGGGGALSGLAAAVPLMRGFDPCQRAAGDLHAAGRSPGRR